MNARVVSLQVHRWGGLFLTVFLVVAGLTGTVLAYHDELEAWLIPDLVNVTPLAASARSSASSRWPKGSPAHTSYHERITRGPSYTPDQAMGHDRLTA